MENTSASSASPSFFVTGGTMPPDAASYIERQADSDLFQTLLRGELCYVLNARQMGKSSLCVRTIQRLKSSNVRTVFLDLTKFGGSNLTPDQWYAALLAEVGRELNLRKECLQYFRQNIDYGPMQRFFGALREVCLPEIEGNLIVFVDEIDVTRSLPFNTDEFFAGIRECYTSRSTNPDLLRLTFCLLGTATPAELIEDARITPFNIGKRIELLDFAPREVAPYARTLPGDAGTLVRILHWTGGHPYLTQTLCRSVTDQVSRNETAKSTNLKPSLLVDRLVSDLFLSHTAKENEANLTLVRDRLLRADCDQYALLTLYQQVIRGKRVPDDDTNLLCDVLKLSGVVRVERGLLRVRNRIYRRVFDDAWIAKHLPGVEVRRERSAFRQGIWRGVLLFSYCNLLFLGLPIVLGSSEHVPASVAKVFTGIAIAVVLSSPIIILFDWFRRSVEFFASRARIRKKHWLVLLPVGIFVAGLGGLVILLNSDSSSESSARNQVKRHESYNEIMNRISEGRSNIGPGDVVRLLESTRKSPDRGFEWGFRHVKSNLPAIVVNGYDTSASRVAFSPDGEQIVTGDANGIVKVWNVNDRVERLTIKANKDFVSAVVYSPDGRYIATGSGDGTLKIWDASNGKELFTLGEHDNTIYRVVFSPNNKLLITDGPDNTVKVWDARTGKEIYTLRGHTDHVNGIVFSPDGLSIVTGGQDGTVKLWDATTFKEVRTFNSKSGVVEAVAVSTDGKRLLTGDHRGNIEVWNIREGRRLLFLEIPRERRWPLPEDVHAVAFSHDGRRIVAGDTGSKIWFWDATTGNRLLKIDTGTPVNSLAFSPDDRRLAVGLNDGTVRIYFSDLQDAFKVISQREKSVAP